MENICAANFTVIHAGIVYTSCHFEDPFAETRAAFCHSSPQLQKFYRTLVHQSGVIRQYGEVVGAVNISVVSLSASLTAKLHWPL